ncbi:MAG: fimbrillin family protein [Duncaniella sp.]|nr:fimbrillin family protein [Duncaniella sp.]MDE7145120.1 fimbrillin family protein [Duncaniella sp.]
MRIHFTPYLISAVVLLASCSPDSTDSPEIPDEGTTTPISFGVSTIPLEAAGNGRGPTISYPSDITSLRLFAPLWVDNGNGYEFEYYEIEDEIVSKNDDMSWSTSTPYYWPGKNKALSFFAYAPLDIKGWETASLPHTHPDQIRFFYTPPSEAENQHDIVFAYDNQILNYTDSPEKKVYLSFSHILANVRFVINGDPTSVYSISLKWLYGESGFNPNGYYWDYRNKDNTGEAMLTSYTVLVPENGVMGDDQTLMIIPQQPTPEDASIIVQLRDGTILKNSFAYQSLMSGAITTININLPTEESASQLTSQLTIASTR